MRKLLTLAFIAALIIMTSSCLAADYTQPGKRQALRFNFEQDGNSLELIPTMDTSVNGLRLNFDHPLNDNPLSSMPSQVIIRPSSKGNSDILGLLLPRFGFEYFGEKQAEEAQFLIQTRSQYLGSRESVIRMQLFAGETEPAASLIINRAASEVTLVENRPYAMGAFLLALIATPDSDDPRVGTCLKRAFNNSFVCKKPSSSHKK